MSFETSGTIKELYDTEQIKETFRKREFVIEQQDGQYPNFIKFQLVQDKCDIMDNFQVGQEVTVSFDLRGRQWQDKYFTNLQAWRIQMAGNGQAAPPPPASDPFPSEEPAQFASGATKDDLPF